MDSGKYVIIKDKKLNLVDLGLDNIYIIQRHSECICEKKYMFSKTDLMAELKQIKKKYVQVKTELNKFKKTEELNLQNKKREEFYDVIININSIVGLKKGWEIKMNEKGLEKYNAYKNKELMSIGVIGNRNKGKSFLLSKISKISLITGESISTEGLSIKYPDTIIFKNRNFILLDSAGLENPVMEDFNQNDNIEKKENKQKAGENIQPPNNNIINDNKENEIKNIIDNKEEKENEINNNNIIDNKEEKDNEINNNNIIDNKAEENENNKEKKNKLKDIEEQANKEFIERARDRIVTELFLQNFIISYSDILILVVGMLTYSEQLLISKIKQEIKNNEKDRKFFIIVHNLKTFTEVEQVEDYIKNRLLKSSTLNLSKKQIINFDYFDYGKEQNENENNNIFKGPFFEIVHCDNGRQIDVYHLILANDDSKAGHIFNKFTYQFIENFYNNITKIEIFDVFQKVKENFIKISPKFITNKISEKYFDTNEEIINNKIMKLNLEKEEKINIKECYKNELGITFFKSNDFIPKYNYFLDKNTLEIRLEAPGNVEKDFKVSWSIEKEYTIIKIKGKKDKDAKPENPDDNKFCNREFGDFELNIPLKTEDYQISKAEPKKGFPTVKKGVVIIQYDIEIQGKEVSIEEKYEDI